ncbi:MAG: DUF4864 domain-containing protein [Sulfitobacter sp.]
MRMRLISALLGMVLAVLTGFSATAQQTEIENTINSQFEAFKADDFAGAFGYATPSLQMLFQSPQNFQRMVTSGYPMVRRPAEVRYLELRERGGALWQKVQITDGKGFVHLLDYKMEQTDMGWRIGAVMILEAPGATA